MCVAFRANTIDQPIAGFCIGASAGGLLDREDAALRNMGRAWVALSLAVGLHVVDEATTGFLDVYNPTAAEFQRRLGLPFPPIFDFGEWLAGLIAFVVLMLAISPFAFRGSRWLRPVAYVFAVLMVLNAIGHTAGTIAGRTFFPWITFQRPMPGFYSSPALVAASCWLLVALRRTADDVIRPTLGGTT